MKSLLPSWLRGGPANIFWLTPLLAVGGSSMVERPTRLKNLGVRAVLDLQAEAADRTAEHAISELKYLKTPVIDFGAPNQRQLYEATSWVLERMQDDEPVFIHCYAGLGRSVTVALATLLRIGYDLPTAYNLVRKERPEIRVTESQLAALREFAEQLPS